MGHRAPVAAGQTRPVPSISHELCQVCSLPARGHLRCRGCSVLAGAGHLDGRLTEDGYCGTCARTNRKNGPDEKTRVEMWNAAMRRQRERRAQREQRHQRREAWLRDMG